MIKLRSDGLEMYYYSDVTDDRYTLEGRPGYSILKKPSNNVDEFLEFKEIVIEQGLDNAAKQELMQHIISVIWEVYHIEYDDIILGLKRIRESELLLLEELEVDIKKEVIEEPIKESKQIVTNSPLEGIEGYTKSYLHNTLKVNYSTIKKGNKYKLINNLYYKTEDIIKQFIKLASI